MFDRLLLLDRNGRELYFGDIGTQASNIVRFFESKGARRCSHDNNPAEWMLHVTSHAPLNGGEHLALSRDYWSKQWEASTQHWENKQYLTRFQVAKDTTSVLHRRNEYATPYYKQFRLVLRHVFRDYWRDPTYLYAKLTLCAGLVSHLLHSAFLHFCL